MEREDAGKNQRFESAVCICMVCNEDLAENCIHHRLGAPVSTSNSIDSQVGNTGGNWQNAWETDNSCAAAYRILGVQQSASIDEIKAAYRKLAIKFHPDKYATQSLQAQKDAEQKFKEVNEAYDTIKKARNFS